MSEHNPARMGTADRRPLNIPMPNNKHRSNGNRLIRIFRLHPLAALLTIIVDIIVFETDTISLETLSAPMMLIAVGLGAIVYVIQRHLARDEERRSLIKAVAIFVLTAIPLPLSAIFGTVSAYSSMLMLWSNTSGSLPAGDADHLQGSPTIPIASEQTVSLTSQPSVPAGTIRIDITTRGLALICVLLVALLGSGWLVYLGLRQTEFATQQAAPTAITAPATQPPSDPSRLVSNPAPTLAPATNEMAPVYSAEKTSAPPPIVANAAPSPTEQVSTRSTARTAEEVPGVCHEESALSCLPRSSRPVTFQDPTAANEAAWRDIHDGQSTTQAMQDAIEDGNSGTVARLCGIIGSNDSSPLAKHLAAQKILSNPGTASVGCENIAHPFL